MSLSPDGAYIIPWLAAAKERDKRPKSPIHAIEGERVDNMQIDTENTG